MSELLSHRLLDLLACPDCGFDLKISNEKQLWCRICERNYEVRNGIPCLYPLAMNEDHLQEEESLADMMKRDHSSKKDQFSSAQWHESKNEFWKMVKKIVNGTNKTFINIGCGFDSHFKVHEKSGNVFVNFDLVYKMLESLKKEHGAEFCVAGDCNKLPFKKGSFDYAISIDVIHHETDQLKSLLKSFADLLKPGGLLFLEDPNAWGLFQAPKSILLPKPLYRFTRSTYHKIKKSSHRPADYEFPTNVWKVKKILNNLDFNNIVVYPNNAYPSISYSAFQ